MGKIAWLGVNLHSVIDQVETQTCIAYERQLYNLDEHRPIGSSSRYRRMMSFADWGKKRVVIASKLLFADWSVLLWPSARI
nr:hypothetical protein [Paenibacillus kribbensis]